MKILKLILAFPLIFIALQGAAQRPNAQHYINKITYKMKDALHLSRDQTKKIYSINRILQKRKAAAWKKYFHQDSLRNSLQSVENSRDSLYKSVLTRKQFLLYENKKMHLINNK